MAHVFGKSVEFRFQPIIGNDPVSVHSLVSARIFKDAPSPQQKDTPATPGFIHEVTSWVDEGDFTKLITFPALVDAEPHSGGESTRYYVVVNFRYESGGAVVFTEEVIDVFKPDALTSRISVDFTDVIRVEPKLDQHYAPGEIEDFIEEAKGDIFRHLEGRGYEKRRLFSLERLNTAAKYRAAALACLSLYNDQAPHWREKFSVRNKQFEDTLATTRPGYDITGTDRPNKDDKITPVSLAYITR